jgi:hypothetical protein
MKTNSLWFIFRGPYLLGTDTSPAESLQWEDANGNPMSHCIRGKSIGYPTMPVIIFYYRSIRYNHISRELYERYPERERGWYRVKK